MKRGDKGKSGAMMTHLIGQAGVWRVASILALRGYNPHFPGVDHGYDLMIDGGIRIQVKASSLVWKKSNPNGVYNFTLRVMNSVQARNLGVSRHRKMSDKNEFVVLWGVDQDTFWVVPAPLLDDVPAVTLGLSSRWQVLDVDRIKSMQAEGMSRDAIGKALGVTDTTITNRLIGRCTNRHENAQTIRSYENKWEIIDSYFQTLTDATASISSAPEAALEPITELIEQ